VASTGAPGGLFSSQAASIFGPSGGAVSSGVSTAGVTGGGKLFGGTGGGLFGGALATAAPAAGGSSASGTEGKEAAAAGAAEEEGDEDGQLVKEEEVTAVAGWTPSITLEVLDAVQTGEEGEEQIYSQRSKLYRFRDGDWKERGLGEAKLLRDKATGRVRFLLRQEKTLKVVANHFIIEQHPYCNLVRNADSEKIWVWCAQDFSEGDLAVEELALKFGSVELAASFKEAFDAAKRENAKLLSKEKKEGAEAAESA